MYLATASLFSRILTTFSSSSLRYCTNAAAKLGVIEFEEVKAGLENKSLTYIDVRNESEVREGKLIGSINIPLPEIPMAFDLNTEDFQKKYGLVKPPKSAIIILGCLYDIRSTKAGIYLQQIGYNSIKIYTGGFNEWKARDGPTGK